MLLAKLPYNKNEARRSINLAYYIAQSKNIKDTNFILGEKIRLGTPDDTFFSVRRILSNLRKKGFFFRNKTAKILKKKYIKKFFMARGEIPFEKTKNILSIISRQETLLIAYKRVKRNRGAMAEASIPDGNTLDFYTPEQRALEYRKGTFPDGICLADFDLASFLILKGDYPWRSSRRIWLDKLSRPHGTLSE